MKKIKRYKLPSAVLSKAKTLLETKAVHKINDYTYTVDGFTTSYMLRISATGKITCHCKSFEESGYCSHSAAVALILEGDDNGKGSGKKLLL